MKFAFFKQSSPNRLTRCGLSHPCPVPSHIGFGPLRSALSGERSCFMHQAPQKKKGPHTTAKEKMITPGCIRFSVCMWMIIPRQNAVHCFRPVWSGRQANAPRSHRCNIATLPRVRCVCFFFLALSDGSSASVLSLSDLQ